MKKKLIITLFITLFLNGNVLAAGGASGGDGDSKSKYDQAVKLIKSAKKK